MSWNRSFKDTHREKALSNESPALTKKSNMGISVVGTSNHGTIMRTGITCKKIPLQKSIEFGMGLKQSATYYKQNPEIFVVTRPPTC